MAHCYVRGQLCDKLENVHYLTQTIKLITSGFGHVLVLSESNQLFSFGRNDCGQLGYESENPDEKDVVKITTIPWDVYGYGYIKSIHCGSLHSIIVSHDNKIYTCGSNSFGQCAIPSLSENVSHFSLVDMDQCLRDRVSIMNAKFAHTGFITTFGELYCCGRNHDGEIGIQNMELVNKFTKVENIPPVKIFDFAWKYIVIVTENNEIFSSKYGILKTDPNTNPLIGKYIGWNPSLNGEIIKVQCGNEHTVILTLHMELFGFGYSPNGEIGTSRDKIVKEIVRIGGSIPDRVCDFVTSYNQLIVFTLNSSLYVSGLNTSNQLNFAPEIDYPPSIKELTKVGNIKYFNSVCIGNQFTIFFHRQDGQSKTEKIFKHNLYLLTLLNETFSDLRIVLKDRQ